MKNNTSKSSITLPPEELKLVQNLMKKLGAKSKVEVVRRGLKLLQENLERRALKESFSRASKITRDEALTYDHLSGEGID